MFIILTGCPKIDFDLCFWWNSSECNQKHFCDGWHGSDYHHHRWLEVWKRSSRHHFLIERVSKWRHGLDFNLQSPYLLLLTNNTWQKLLVQLLSHKCRPITLTERRDWSKQGDDGHYTAGKRSCRRSFVFWESRSGNWKSRWLRFEWSK